MRKCRVEFVGGLGCSVCLCASARAAWNLWGLGAFRLFRFGVFYVSGRVELQAFLGWSCVCAAWNLWRIGAVRLFRFGGFYVSGWEVPRGTCGGLGRSVCLCASAAWNLWRLGVVRLFRFRAFYVSGWVELQAFLGWSCVCAAWNLWGFGAVRLFRFGAFYVSRWVELRGTCGGFGAFRLPMRKCTCCVELVGVWGVPFAYAQVQVLRGTCLDLGRSVCLDLRGSMFLGG